MSWLSRIGALLSGGLKIFSALYQLYDFGRKLVLRRRMQKQIDVGMDSIQKEGDQRKIEEMLQGKDTDKVKGP